MANDYTGDNSGDLFRLEMVEEDGFPDVKGVKKIIVSDGSLSDLGNGVVQLATGGGSGGAGGLTTQVQYNKSGNFAGNPGFTYDEITQSVVVGGNVDIGGKLTVAGLIDPTGLELTPQAVNPSNANTLWLDSGNSNKLKQGAVNIIQAGDPISDLLNDVGFVTSATSPVQSVFGRTGVISAVAGDYTTDEVTEGANLYYTDARVQTVISLSDLDDLQNVTITSVADGEALVFDSATTSWVNSALPSAPVSSVFGRTGSITAQSGDYTTSQVTEGSNLYFTNARADARIAAANIDDLNDVVITTPTNGQALTFDSGSGNWVNTALPSAPVTSVNSQTGVVVLDTDDISEGATNLYYTTARFNTDFGTKDTDDLTEGASNLYFTSARASAAAPVQSVNGLTGTVVLSTTAIAEGTNLYFTDARADARIAAADIEDLNDVTVSTPSTGEVLTYSAGVWGNAAVPSAPVDSVNGQTGVVVLDTDDVSEGVSNLYYTTARFDTAFSGKDTDDLSEGATNLYFTNARADARISAADIGDLNDVVITSVADNQALIYDSATSQWKNEVLPSAPVTSVNTLTGAVVLDTDDISEGATNLYYTSARFDASFAGKTTTNLSEGANLYYTTTRFNTDFAASALGSLSDVAITTPSTGQALTFDSGSGNWVNTALPSAPVDSVNGLTGTVVLDTDDISEGATNLYFTNARASAAAPVQSVNGSTGTVVLTTTNISEGTNLYYTDARVDARIAAASIDDLSDVVITTASSGQVLTYNGTNWVNQAVPSAPVTSVNGQTGVVSLASTDLTDTASIVYGGDNVSRLTNDAGYYSSGDNISVGTITTSALANALLYADATGLHSSVSIGSGLSFTGGTLSATGSGGTVTSIDVSGGTTGLTYTGGPITTSGTITMAGTLAVANGGTGATTDSGARTNLGLGAVAVANDTDGVPEGAANLYYTNARVDAQIAAANIDDLNDVVITTASSGQALTYNGTNWVNTTLSSAPVDSVNGQTGVVVLDTDDISEGATNLYYTTARFDTAFSGKDTDDLTEGATNFYYTTARFDASFAGKTTTNLSEGSNLYYTNARADARIAAANIDDLNDVVITTVSSGQALTYNGTNWVNTTLSSAPVDSVNGQTGVVVLDTDDISEGSTNLYYTSARFDASFAGKTTTNLSEGSNLYFTDARADARIAAASIDDLSDVVITTASTNEVLTYNGTNWVNQAVPSAPVTSVNGYTGVVSLASTDLTDTASLIRNGSNISLLNQRFRLHHQHGNGDANCGRNRTQRWNHHDFRNNRARKYGGGGRFIHKRRHYR